MLRITRWGIYTNLVLSILFFLLGASWLLAPFAHGNGLGHLHFISNYEGTGQPWSWAFRASDIISAVIYSWLIFRHQVWHKDKPMALLLYIIAALAAIDSIFPETCRAAVHHLCVETHSFSLDVHLLESTVIAIVILLAIVLDVWRRQKLFSGLFLLVQLLFFVFDKTHGISGQALATMQYIYEVILLIWLLYVLEAYAPQRVFPRLLGKPYRAILAVWVGVSGVLAIVISAAHLHLYGAGLTFYFTRHLPWIAQQTALTGVLLLYLARQIYRGQRRAAYILLVIFGFELIKYSILEPHAVLASLYGLTFIVLFLVRHSFVHNTGPLTLHRRLLDLLVVLGGVVAALGMVSAILLAVGRFGHVVTLIDTGTDYVQQNQRHLPLHGHRLQQTLDTLGTGTVLIVAWIVFRPKRTEGGQAASAEDRLRVKGLLTAYSRSSEDYFKLWPTDKSYFFSADGDGFIAYKVVHGSVFALADPVAPTSAKQRRLLDDFTNFCTSSGWNACFLPVSEASKGLYSSRFQLLPIGSSAVIDVTEFNTKTRSDKWWRWKHNQAVKAGLHYHLSDPPHTTEFLHDLKDASDAWLGHDGRREQGFALGYFDPQYLTQCRIHYLLDKQDEVVAFTNELPVFHGAQATVDLLRYVPEHNAAMPFLLMSLLETLHKEARYTKFDLGFVPLAQLESRPVQLIKAVAKIRFSAAGLEQFKNKFRPAWTTQYIAFSGDKLDLPALAIGLETALKQESKK